MINTLQITIYQTEAIFLSRNLNNEKLLLSKKLRKGFCSIWNCILLINISFRISFKPHEQLMCLFLFVYGSICRTDNIQCYIVTDCIPLNLAAKLVSLLSFIVLLLISSWYIVLVKFLLVINKIFIYSYSWINILLFIIIEHSIIII